MVNLSHVQTMSELSFFRYRTVCVQKAVWPEEVRVREGIVKVCRERAFNGDTAMSPLDRQLSLYRVSLAE